MLHAIVRPMILAAALIVPSAPVWAGANFNAFLAGLDKACARSADFEALQTSLSAKYGAGGDSRTAIVVPPSLGTAIGAVTSDEVGDHIRVNVALDGTFRGLKLSKLVFYFGLENGIFGWAVEFAEPADRLRKTLGNAVTRGNERLARGGEAGASTGLDLENGRVALFCDLSS